VSHSFAVFQILVKDEYSHSESRIINGEVVSLSSIEEGDGLETAAGETPALWEVNKPLFDGVFLIFPRVVGSQS
jgi:hypothetical protein